MDGILLIDKPEGITSSQVVVKIRKHFKFDKVGHAGTLDPLGTGLLVVLVGKATKQQDTLMGADKKYEGTILLGQSTDTDDVTGEILATAEIPVIDEKVLESVVKHFTGEQEQTAPIYSALKVAGVPSYKRARRGETVTPKTRTVTIHNLELSFEMPNRLRYQVHCSKGTYVRSLARDIGDFLGTKACMETLRRTYSAPYSITDAATLDEVLSSGGKRTVVSVHDCALVFAATTERCPPEEI